MKGLGRLRFVLRAVPALLVLAACASEPEQVFSGRAKDAHFDADQSQVFADPGYVEVMKSLGIPKRVQGAHDNCPTPTWGDCRDVCYGWREECYGDPNSDSYRCERTYDNCTPVCDRRC